MTVDTSARSNIWSLDQFLKSDFAISELSSPALSLHAANTLPVSIALVSFARIIGRPGAKNLPPCHSMICISLDVIAIYLLSNLVLQIGIINRGFTVVGKFQQDGTTNVPRIRRKVMKYQLDLHLLDLFVVQLETMLASVPQRTAYCSSLPQATPFPMRATRNSFSYASPESNDKMQN